MAESTPIYMKELQHVGDVGCTKLHERGWAEMDCRADCKCGCEDAVDDMKRGTSTQKAEAARNNSSMKERHNRIAAAARFSPTRHSTSAVPPPLLPLFVTDHRCHRCSACSGGSNIGSPTTSAARRPGLLRRRFRSTISTIMNKLKRSTSFHRLPHIAERSRWINTSSTAHGKSSPNPCSASPKPILRCISTRNTASSPFAPSRKTKSP